MHKSKLLALLLAIAMVVSMVVVPAYAASEVTFTLAADKATVEPGGTVVLTFGIGANTGFYEMESEIAYEEGWTIASRSTNLYKDTLTYNAGSIIRTQSPDTTKNPHYVSIIGSPDEVSDEQLTGTGPLYSLTFTAPETAGTYTFTPTVKNVKDVNSDDVVVTAPAAVTVTVAAAEAPAEPSECPECGQSVTWTEVKAADWANGAALTSGHYKLVEDVAPTTTASAVENAATAAALSVAAGETVCIDLNGHNITAGALAAASDVSYRVFYNEGTLSIMDKTAAEVEGVYTAGIISGGAMKTQGNNEYDDLGYGGNVCNMGGTFTLHSGIIADGYLTGGAFDGGDNGGNIYSDGGVLNIKGGIVRDGSSKRTSQNGSAQGGGNIYAKDTDVNITGGTISGGRLYGTYNYTNTDDRRSFLRGGNLFVTGGSLEISNATISGGKIEYELLATQVPVTMEAYGGNVYAFTADVNISNSSITNGLAKTNATGKTTVKCESFGGNLYFVGADNTLTIDEKSTISGGQAVATGAAAADVTATVTNAPYGGNIYLKSGTMNMGGTISGGSATCGVGVFMVDGTANVTGTIEDCATPASKKAYLGSGMYIKAGTVDIDGTIQNCSAAYNGSAIYMENGTVTLDGTIDNCDCANRGAGVYQVKGTLTVNGTIKNCDTASSGRGGAVAADGGSTNIYGIITACTASRGSAYFTPGAATLNVYDGAYIYGNKCTGGYGTICMVGTTATMNMYGGTITNSVSGDPTVYNMYSNVNVYGGVIENTETNAINTYYSSSGTPVVKIYSGTIDGTLRLDKNVICDVYGGSVANMTVNATAVPNIYNAVLGFDPTTLTSATNNVAACSVLSDSHLAVMHAEGTCATCGHTFVKSGDTVCATCNVVHTLIPCAHAFGDSNTCSVCGLVDNYVGGACAHGCENPTWVRWDGNDFTEAGHYYVVGDMQLPVTRVGMSGVDVCLDLNGKTVTAGANCRAFWAYNCTFNLMDSSAEKTGTVVGNGVLDTNNPGLVYITSATFNMYDCTIKDGHHEYNIRYTEDGLPYSNGQGGNLMLNNSVGNMYGTATIKDGIAGYRAGNVYLSGGVTPATLNMYDNSKILDGRLEVKGELISPEATAARAANVYVSSNTFLNLHDNATISGGEGGLNECYVYGYDNGKDEVTAGITLNGGSILCATAVSGADLTVNAGTMAQDITKYMGEGVCLNDVSEGTWTVSADLPTEYDAEDIITLGKNVNVDELDLYATLNLNGYTLTANKVDAYNGDAHIVDNKGTGSVVSSDVKLNIANNQVAVPVDGGYVFETVSMRQKIEDKGEGVSRLKFVVDDEAEKTQLDDAIKAGKTVEFQITVTWADDHHTYTVPAATVAEFAESWGSKMFTCTISGLNNLTGPVTISAELVSGGVVLAALDVTNA